MAEDVKVVTKPCILDADGCVSLKNILKSFNAPINEEYAWALCYQCAKCFQEAFESDREKCCVVSDLEHVLLHKDGSVHKNTIFASRGKDSRSRATSETKTLFHLGSIIWNALDYGLQEFEEKHLSQELDALIDIMTSAGDDTPSTHHETDDEGIERDSGEADDDTGCSTSSTHAVTFNLVLRLCTERLGKRTDAQADAHYRAVVRALVAEALDLSSFLQKVSQGTSDLQTKTDTTSKEIDKLQFSDWTNQRIWEALQTRLWVQVIHELRNGVKLKKVDYSRTPIEFEMTPYEILMDDIRSRRYKLNKVMVDGDIPHRVKKDAHAIILEFIRSRPPLKKASERKLNPAVSRPCTPREALMDSIKQGRPLKPSFSPLKQRAMILAMGGSSRPAMGIIPPEMTRSCPPAFGSELDDVEDVLQKEEYWGKKRVVPADEPAASNDDSAQPNQTRRLIQVDFSLIQSDDDDDEPMQMPVSSKTGKEFVRTGTLKKNVPSVPSVYQEYVEQALEPYDLATQCPTRRASVRRHTIVTCEGDRGVVSVPQSRPLSRQSDASRSSGGEELAQLGATNPEMSWSRTSLQEDIFQSKTWAQECLSLTLEEIVHIRSVLTKAELEALPVDGHVKEDVEKRKVCFLCLKTRFSIWSWGQKCRLCKRTICQKCLSKMRIPTEHFSHVPVVALSPSLLNSPDEDDTFPRALASRLGVPEARNSVGSAPSSPQLTRESASAPGSRAMSRLGVHNDGALSLPPASPSSTVSDRRSRMSRSTTLSRTDRKAEKLKGMEMTVCHDCKAMVIQIIKSSRNTRNNAIRNLTLNLSPVY